MNLTLSAFPPQSGSLRKREFHEYVEAGLNEQDRRGKFNAAYREDDRKFIRFLIPPGKRVLELGCGRGELLAAIEPSYGVGVDFGARTVAKAKELHPHLHFVLGDVEDPGTLAAIEGPFDYVVIADTIGMFEDIDGTLKLIHHLCAPSTRIIISCYPRLWEPILKLAELVRLRSRLRKDCEVLARERACFGNCDPFGGFDLIFGAAKQNLKIVETPIHCKARTFGETQISRFRDGWLLLKMMWFAYRKLKAV
jgi:SAM-dependent methyltransferase